MRKNYLYNAMPFVAVLSILAMPIQAAQLITNGGFEPDLSGWTRADQIGSDGSFLLQSGTSSPVIGDPVPSPPGPVNAAMTDAQGPGSHTMYQDFTVPGVVPSGSVSFMLFLNNQAAVYSVPNTLDFATPTLNQQFRVDIITTLADPFSVAPADVLQTIYKTTVGDPLTSGYTLVQADISATLNAHLGQTLRLRFAEVDNVNIFHAGVDDVSINVVPEPGTLTTIAAALLGFIATCRRRK